MPVCVNKSVRAHASALEGARSRPCVRVLFMYDLPYLLVRVRMCACVCA